MDLDFYYYGIMDFIIKLKLLAPNSVVFLSIFSYSSHSHVYNGVTLGSRKKSNIQAIFTTYNTKQK